LLSLDAAILSVGARPKPTLPTLAEDRGRSLV